MLAMSALPPPYAPIRHAAPLAEKAEIALDALAVKGLLFRKINPKEAFTLEDSEGHFFRASLLGLDGDRGRALVYERMRGSPESPAEITLVCAVLQRQRMLVVVQKATELGCVRVVPVISERSVQPRDLDHEKPWAWAGQALKGARQCRRASVPEVLGAQPLAKALAAPFWRDARARYVLDDRAERGSDPFPPPPASGAVPAEPGGYVLVVGPEGGWTDAELKELAAKGATPLSWGARVLRAETAVFAGLAVLQHRLGDLR
jgi:16S rRNA (uracil1498-N3)-methyltransferase